MRVPALPPPNLDDRERLALLDTIDAIEDAVDPAALQAVLDGPVQHLLPHGGVLCGTVAAHGPAAGWTTFGIEPDEAQQAAVAAAARLSQHLPWAPALAEVGLDHALVHGADGGPSSAVCFVRMPVAPTYRHVYCLSRLAPHLHFAVLRTRQHAAGRRAAHGLSQRQVEVLRWVRVGKTNAEVALILRTTEANVKYHLKTIFRRLGAFSRTLAVSKAIALGLID